MKKVFFALTLIGATAFTSDGARAAVSAAQGITNSISTRDQAALQEFGALMHKLVENPPADCSGPIDAKTTKIGLDTERQIFHLLAGAVLDALNKTPNGPVEQTMQTVLAPFQGNATQVAASWATDRRLRYELLPVQPLLVLKLAVWNQDTFIVYAPASASVSPSSHWEITQSGGTGDAAFEKLEMFPLWRGPSGNPRFLVVKHFSDCMAGVTYDYTVNGYEWNGEQGATKTILHKQSEFSEEHSPPGKLQATGKVIAIPYCWSGDLHFTSVSAPICSLDTYALSSDTVRLVGTQNDPEDLALIENVIASAESRNSAALAAHCKTSEIALSIMKNTPRKSFLLFDGYSSKDLGAGREQVDFNGDTTMEFALEKRGPRWVVAGFKLNN